MIASFFVRAGLTPPAMNSVMVLAGAFSRDPSDANDWDYLSNNSLSVAFPGSFVDSVTNGFNAAAVHAAVISSDSVAILHLVKPNFVHFVIAWTADGVYIGDPNGGVVRKLSYYGATVANTVIVTFKPKPAPAPIPAPAPAPKPAPAPTAPPVVVPAPQGHTFPGSTPPAPPVVVPQPLPAPVAEPPVVVVPVTPAPVQPSNPQIPTPPKATFNLGNAIMVILLALGRLFGAKV